MAVVAVWKCDRDGTMFDNKKDAEEHDKMLELAANITSLIEQHITVDEKISEAIGLLLAERRDKLATACKGKPEVLLEADEIKTGNEDNKNQVKSAPPTTTTTTTISSADSTNSKVTTLAANQ